MTFRKALRRALALIASAAELLFLGGSVPCEGNFTPPVVEQGGNWTQIWEDRVCTACGTEGLFWSIYEPDSAETHIFMTMCLTCGAINGDLPQEDPAHWRNVFRTEPHQETVYVTEPDCVLYGLAEHVCVRCGESWTEELSPLGHQFGEWTTEKNPQTGEPLCQVRSCIRCGQTERREVPPEESNSPEPTEPPEAAQTPAPSPSPSPQRPEQTAPPDAPSTPEPKPEPESTPEPTLEPTEEPSPWEEPADTAAPEPPVQTAVPVETEAPEPTATAAASPPESAEPTQTREPFPAPSPAPSAEQNPPVSVQTEKPAAPKRYGPYVSGTPDGLFLPDQRATRADAAVMVARVLADKRGDLYPAADLDCSFPDVPKDAWYACWIADLERLGVLPDTEDGLFRPEECISEEELLVLLKNAFGKCPAGEERNTLTRADCVSLINRASDRMPDGEWLDAHRKLLKQFPDVREDHWAWPEVMASANGRKEEAEND